MSDNSDLISEDDPLDESAAAVAAAGLAAAAAKAEDDDKDRAAYVGWLFILLLAILFSILMFWAFSRDDGAGSSDTGDTESGTTQTAEEDEATGTSTAVLLTVSDDGSVAISGSVPDEGARRQLIDSAIRIYGPGRVVDDLVIDGSVTLVGGTISTTGLAPHGDTFLASLVESASQLGLAPGEMSAGFSDLELESVAVQAAIQTNSVSLSGAVPSAASIDLLVQTAGEIFGVDNVDGSGLNVDSSKTLQDASISLTGLLDTGDSRGLELADRLSEAFPGANVESGSLAVDTSPEALGRLEEKLRVSIGETPILFGSGSGEIDEASLAIIAEVATAIQETPDVPVEIVGHTDDSGSDELNQQLSEERAFAVRLRLIELGVDPDRLTSRGAGESEPIADNSTDEGKAANRRIAFEFLGATG